MTNASTKAVADELEDDAFGDDGYGRQYIGSVIRALASRLGGSDK